MVTLLEAKLNSLPPEITSKFPPLGHCSLDDINPVINPITNFTNPQVNELAKNNNNNNQPVIDNQKLESTNAVENKIENSHPVELEVIQEELTPEQTLKNFIEANSSEVEGFYKMLKFGIPEQAVIQKAMFTNANMSLVNVIID
jgi:hypothetical protein